MMKQKSKRFIALYEENQYEQDELKRSNLKLPVCGGCLSGRIKC